MNRLTPIPNYAVADFMNVMTRSLAATSLLTRYYGQVIRVRRRGFSRDVRRGDDLPWSASSDGKARVVRRSRHSLWLEIDRPAEIKVGDTVQVRLPKRWQ